MAALLMPLERTVAAAFRQFEDGIRRWRDLDLAEWLEMANPAAIRTVLKDNRSLIEEHGGFMAVPLNPGRLGGAPGTEYWLTFEQALVVCTLSRTPRADSVRTVMIKVFSAVVQGKYDPVDGAIVKLTEQVCSYIETSKDVLAGFSSALSDCSFEIRETKQELRATREDVREISKRLEPLEEVARRHRRDPDQATRRTQLYVLDLKYAGECPGCRQLKLLENGKLTDRQQWDHEDGNPKNASFENIWPLCKDCHHKKHYGMSDQKRELRSRFETFQSDCEVARPKRLPQVIALPIAQGELF